MMCSVLGVNNWENILDAFPIADLSNMNAVLLHNVKKLSCAYKYITRGNPDFPNPLSCKIRLQ